MPRLILLSLSALFCAISCCAYADSSPFPADNPPVVAAPTSAQSEGSDSTAPTQQINLKKLIPQALSSLIVDGAVDARFRQANTGRSNGVYIQSLEIDLQQPIVESKVQQGSAFIQLIGENPPDVFKKEGVSDFAIGEAYVSYRIPVMTDTDSTSYVRVGQFVLPVGLMATYDTHQEIIQSLYAEGIGERTDWGIALNGRFYGVLDYNFAVTSGDGPGHLYAVPDRVVAFRLGRLFVTPYGTFNLGGSLLGGRLPITEVNPMTDYPPELPPSGKVAALYGYEDKTRIIGDGQWTYGAVSARGEVMVGSDTNTSVNGSFVEGEYRFAPGLSAVIADSYWNYGVGNSTSSDLSAGFNIAYGRNVVLRTVWEFQRDVPSGSTTPSDIDTHLRKILTTQLLLRF